MPPTLRAFLIIAASLLPTTLAACGSDGASDTADGVDDGDLGAVDATRGAADAAPALIDATLGGAVTVVDCAAAEFAGDLWYYSGLGFITPPPIPVGGVIRIHDLEGHTVWSDLDLWMIDSGPDVCLQFDEVGSYPWHCYFHSEVAEEHGAIVVE